MNNDRRKALSQLIDRTEAFALALSALATERDDLTADLESLRDEEQDYFDNMPESFQSGDKGDTAQAAIDSMEEALSELQGLELDFDPSSAISSMDDARGAA